MQLLRAPGPARTVLVLLLVRSNQVHRRRKFNRQFVLLRGSLVGTASMSVRPHVRPEACWYGGWGERDRRSSRALAGLAIMARRNWVRTLVLRVAGCSLTMSLYCPQDNMLFQGARTAVAACCGFDLCHKILCICTYTCKPESDRAAPSLLYCPRRISAQCAQMRHSCNPLLILNRLVDCRGARPSGCDRVGAKACDGSH